MLIKVISRVGWFIIDIIIITILVCSRDTNGSEKIEPELKLDKQKIQVIQPILIDPPKSVDREVDPLSEDYWIDIDIEEQKIYLYKNDLLITHGDIVSGYKYVCDTPTGQYQIQYKEEDTYLTGSNDDGTKYLRHVNYWMPFYNNYGIHDADWRTEFGDDIYEYNGSHGCINISVDLAEKIFPLVSTGTIVNIN